MKITVLSVPEIKKGRGAGVCLLLRTENHNFLYGFSSDKKGLKMLKAAGISSDIVDTAFLPDGENRESGGVIPFLSANPRAVVYARVNAFEKRYKKGVFGMKDASPKKTLEKIRRIKRCKNYFLSADNSFVTFSLTESDRVHVAPQTGDELLLKNENGEYVPDDLAHEMYLLVREGKKWYLICGAVRAGLKNVLPVAKRIVEKSLGGSLGGAVFSIVPGEDVAAVAEYLKGVNYPVFPVTNKKSDAEILKSVSGDRVTPLSAGETKELTEQK